MPAPTAILDGQVVRTGKRKPRVDKRTLGIAPYMSIPMRYPDIVHRTQKFPNFGWGTMNNTTRGDCTCAAAGHAQQITSLVSPPVHDPTADAILAAYWATGNPPGEGLDDNGRYCLDILKYWKNVGIAGRKAKAFAQIDLEHLHGQIRWSIAHLGFCYLGVGLPVTAQVQTQWRLHFPLTAPEAQPYSWGGHAIVAVNYDSDGCDVITWGKVLRMGWGFLREYCDEAWAVITAEWLNSVGKSIEGLNLAALEADIAAIN